MLPMPSTYIPAYLLGRQSRIGPFLPRQSTQCLAKGDSSLAGEESGVSGYRPSGTVLSQSSTNVVTRPLNDGPYAMPVAGFDDEGEGHGAPPDLARSASMASAY